MSDCHVGGGGGGELGRADQCELGRDRETEPTHHFFLYSFYFFCFALPFFLSDSNFQIQILVEFVFKFGCII
jgi:hypothetical protein